MPLPEIPASDDRTLQEIADLLAKSHKILVITGAGISTACGIPDFRSKDGLYNLIPTQSFLPTPPSSAPSTPSRKRNAPVDDEIDEQSSSQFSSSSTNSRRSPSTPPKKLRGQDLFDARVWKDPTSTEVHYQFIASLRQKIAEIKETSKTHKFIRTLRDGGRLMRCYTQNIDGLEAREGLCMDLSRGKGNKRRFMKKQFRAPLPTHTKDTDFDGGCEVVPLHGDLERLRCNLCQSCFSWTEDATEIFLNRRAPECEACSQKSDSRRASGKRGLSVGTLRANIVLYGEDHPSNHLVSPLVPFDIASEPEVLIIMGTSLKVFGLQKIIREFAKAVHAHKSGGGRVIFINRERPSESIWDGIIDEYIAMDCDEWVEDLKGRREDLWLRQGELKLKVSKPAAKKKRKSADDVPSDRPHKQPNLEIVIPRILTVPPKPYHGAGSFRTKMTLDNPFAGMLTPPRPTYSPFTKSFRSPRDALNPKNARPMSISAQLSPSPKSRSGTAVFPGTPERPPFSPLSPISTSLSRLRGLLQNPVVYEDEGEGELMYMKMVAEMAVPASSDDI